MYISVDIVGQDVQQLMRECFLMVELDVEPEEWDVITDRWIMFGNKLIDMLCRM